MSISLLHIDKTNFGIVDDATIYNLEIENSFSVIYPNSRERKSFMTVLRHPLLNEASILYRQNTIKDFINNPALLEELDLCLRGFKDIVDSHKVEKRILHRAQASNFFDKSSNEARDILQMNSLTTKKLLISLQELYSILKKYSIIADSLISVRQKLYSIVETDTFRNIIETCLFFEHFSLNGNVNCKFTLDEIGKVGICQLISRRYVAINNPELSKKKFGIFNKKTDDTDKKDISVKMNRLNGTMSEKLMISSILDVADIFENFIQELKNDFYDLYEELSFYKVSLKYYKYMSSLGLPITFPGISDQDEQIVDTIYDVRLITQADDVKVIVPYSLSLLNKNDNVIILGDNGAGKTTLLRALGTMQILAQAGLPIVAENVKVKIYNCILSQFSEKEKDFGEGTESGRFEQEVCDLKSIVDKASPRSCVLLNETFQSTNYEEGSEALSDILRYFTYIGASWILVTHMHEILKYLPLDNMKTINLEKGFRFKDSIL